MSSFARDFPKLKALDPPACICRKKKNHSPMISTIEISRHGHVRRAKLNYLRQRVGKRARVKQRRYLAQQAGGERAGEEGIGDAPAGGEEENTQAR